MRKKFCCIPDGAVITEEKELNFIVVPIPPKKKDSHSGDDSLSSRLSNIQAISTTVATKSKHFKTYPLIEIRELHPGVV